ncbi:MAG TPA: PrsW family glutamic-type intramembrane protease [Anaerolineaceae bacterium]|nr:PrsW family glutamic-type intramembrane protease [Anaerolineaceae bacterium]
MTSTTVPDRSRGLSIAQLVLSIIALTITLVSALTMLILFNVPGLSMIGTQPLEQLKTFMWVNGLIGLIAVPSLVLSIRRLAGRPAPQRLRHGLLVASLALLLVPLLVLLVEKNIPVSLPAGIMALINVLVVGLPLWWLIELGSRRLKSGSRQRCWGLSTLSLFVTMPVIMTVEILFLLVVVVFGSVWITRQPGFIDIVNQLQNQLMMNPFEIQGLVRLLEPMLTRPEVGVAALLGICLFIPLIEEFLKPLGLWFLSRHDLTPAEGFTAGLVCGAAFALLESSLSLTAVSGEAWLTTAAGRLGTGLLHTLTAGLNGWALVSTWREGKFLRQAAVYILTVLLHGTWNLFALLAGLREAGGQFQSLVNPGLAAASPWVLGGLAALMLAGLFFANFKLRPDETPLMLPPELPQVLE